VIQSYPGLTHVLTQCCGQSERHWS